ncbi:MAG: DUF3226 domain-containing protein [Bacteroidales bacterium]
MIQIYVEGNPDELLIKAIIKKYFPKTLISHNIIQAEGYTNIGKLEHLSEKNRNIPGGKNLVIFDADSINHPDGGVVERSKFLNSKNRFIDDIFLFPNHKDDGDIEILLEQIVNPAHQVIIDCFNRFQDDIEKQFFVYNATTAHYVVPAQKAKIFSYAQILKDSFEKHTRKDNLKNLKPQTYCLADDEFWDLNSQALDPLVRFLSKYF